MVSQSRSCSDVFYDYYNCFYYNYLTSLAMDRHHGRAGMWGSDREVQFFLLSFQDRQLFVRALPRTCVFLNVSCSNVYLPFSRNLQTQMIVAFGQMPMRVPHIVKASPLHIRGFQRH